MDDRARVEELLGRPPRGSFEVVVRDDTGDPVVVRNEPFLDDGTPMPTRYYLVGAELVKRVSRLEADGGVRRAEAIVPAAEIADVHRRYRDERDAHIDPAHDGPRPSGGVGGTRKGVKCLHAHVAHHLATGHDPVGAWALAQLDTPATGSTMPESPMVTLTVDDDTTGITMQGGETWSLPLGAATLANDIFESGDPPRPEALTNAIGLIQDHLEDVLMEAPSLLAAPVLRATGTHVVMLGRVEVGQDRLPADYRLSRPDAEEVFRTLVADNRDGRADNPGLDLAHANTIVGTTCVVLAVMRRLQVHELHVDEAPGDHIRTAASRRGR